ncbi:MAG: hypothetical protein ABI528_09110 [bacterium]
MKIMNSKLFDIINTLSKSDIKEFKKFIRSPVYSKGRNYVLILNQIAKLQQRKSTDTESQKLYSKIYPGKKFNSQTLKNRLSELFKLAEEFMIYKTLKENPLEKQKLLLLSYYKNKNVRLYESKYNIFNNQLQSLPDNDLKFLNTIYIKRQHLDFLRKQEISEYAFDRYYDFSFYTTCIFLTNLFEFGIEFLQQEQTERNYEFNIVKDLLAKINIDEILEKAAKINPHLSGILSMQYFFYKAFKDPDEEKNYFEGRRVFDRISPGLSEDYKINQYNIMTYYCIIRHNYGIKKFQLELFKLYNEKLKLGIHLDIDKKYFPVRTFRNYVLLGIILKKFEWTEKFINKYSKELPVDTRDDETKLSYSRLYFGKREYGRSMSYLANFRSTNYLHYCDSSVLKLCTYYETEKFEEAFSEMDKFRHYLRNHKEIPKIHKIYTSNFLKMYQMLIKIKTDAGKKDLYEIVKLYEKTPLASRRNWLGEKITQLA